MEKKVKELLKYYRSVLRDSGADNKIAEEIIVKSISKELDKAREEGKKEMVENLLKKAKHMAKDYFTGQTKIYIDKKILEEELSKLKDKE